MHTIKLLYQEIIQYGVRSIYTDMFSRSVDNLYTILIFDANLY